MIDFFTFKEILNKYWIKVIGNYIPNSLAEAFYQAYLKAYIRKKINAKDFIKLFFAYVGKGKGLYVNKKA